MERRGLRRNTKRKGGRASSGEDHLNEKYYTSRTHPHFHASPVRAAALFDTAHCARCHRFTLYPSSPPPLQAHRYTSAWSACVRYISAYACNDVVLLSLSLLLFHAFLPFFLFLLLFFLLAQATTRFKRAENRIIMRAGQWESSGKLPYANLAVCAEAVTISMKGETASERNSRPSLPSHDKIRYEILSSHGIEGKIIVDQISIINRFIAIPRKFSFFFRAAIKITRICGTSHD